MSKKKNTRRRKTKNSGCNLPLNPFHSTDGSFASPDSDPKGSWSCPDKTQRSRRGRSLRFTRTPCGRRAREKGSDVRCHDGKKLDEELYQYIRSLVEEELSASPALSEYEHLHIPTLIGTFREEISAGKDGSLSEADCSQCVASYLKGLNAAIRASKGEWPKK
jgi:hypothetical protein